MIAPRCIFVFCVWCYLCCILLGMAGQRGVGVRRAITAIPFTGLIDADCRFTVYSRSSTNGPVPFYISNFVLEVKLLLFPTNGLHQLAPGAQLVLRHGPSASLQGVAIFARTRDGQYTHTRGLRTAQRPAKVAHPLAPGVAGASAWAADAAAPAPSRPVAAPAPRLLMGLGLRT